MTRRVALRSGTKIVLVPLACYVTLAIAALGARTPSSSAGEHDAESAAAVGGPVPEEERFAWQPKELVNVFGTHRGRHWWEASAVAFSPDGKLIATGSGDRILRLWDARTLRERESVMGLPGSVGSVAFAPDGRQLAAAVRILEHDGNFSEIRIWELAADGLKELHRLTGFEQFIDDLVYSSDGSTLVADDGYGRTIHLYDMTGPRPLQRRVLPLPRSVWEIEISRDGELLVAACGESVVLWDLARPKPRERARLTTDALSVAISQDGNTLVTGASFREESIRVWSLEQDEPQERMVLGNVAKGGITALEFSPDGSLLASSAGTQNTIRLWKVLEGCLEEHVVLTGHVAKVFDLAFSPDGRQLASVASDHSLRLWEIDDRPRESDVSQSAHEGLSSRWLYDQRKIKCLRGGRSLLTVSSRGPALFDMIDRRIRTQCHISDRDTYLFRPMQLAPDEKTLATVLQTKSADDGVNSAKVDRAVVLWDLTSGKRLRTLSPHPSPVGGLTFRRDSRQVATVGEDGQFRVWDVTSGELIVTFPSGSEKTPRLWLFDGDALVSTHDVVSDLGEPQVEIQMWHRSEAGFTKGKSWTTPRSDTGCSIVVSDDGTLLAIQNRGRNIEVWEIRDDGARRQTNIEFTDPQCFIASFSPDGTLLSMKTWGKFEGHPRDAVAVWDIAARQIVHTWPLPGSVSDAVFTSDSRHLVTANLNGTVYVLRIPQRTAQQTPAEPPPNDSAKQAEPVVNPDAEKRFSALKREFDKEFGEYQRLFKAAQTRAERDEIVLDEPHPKYAQRLMKLAREFPDTTAERDALLWISKARRTLGSKNAEFQRQQSELFRLRREAGDRLLDRYVRDKRLADVVSNIVLQPDHRRGADAARRLIRESPHREVQGRAYFILVRVLKNYQPSPYARRRGLSDRDREVIVGLLKRIINEYGDVPDWRHGTLKKAAEVELAKLSGTD